MNSLIESLKENISKKGYPTLINHQLFTKSEQSTLIFILLCLYMSPILLNMKEMNARRETFPHSVRDSDFIDIISVNGFFLCAKDYSSECHILECYVCRIRIAEDKLSNLTNIDSIHEKLSSFCPIVLLQRKDMNNDESRQFAAWCERSIKHLTYLYNHRLKNVIEIGRELGHKEDQLFLSLFRQFISEEGGFNEEYGGSITDYRASSIVKQCISLQLLNRDISLDQQILSSFLKYINDQSIENTQALQHCESTTHLINHTAGAVTTTTREIEETTSNLMGDNLKLIVTRVCKRCGRRSADYLCLPCGHISFCDSCVDESSHCPLCDIAIGEKIKVYYS